MLFKYPNLFITSYKEIRGFKGEDLHIEIKEGANPVRQRLRRMGQERVMANFTNLFITSYEEIRGFKGEDLGIELKEDAKTMCQRLRRMGQEQMMALKKEVDKLLKVDFI